MNTATGTRIVALAFLKLSLRSKRTRTFFVLALVPPVLLALVGVLSAGARHGSAALTFADGPAPSFFFQLLIPLLALFYGSTVVSDEIEDKTLVYLVTRPAPRGALFLGKALASLAVAAVVTLASLLAAFVTTDPAGLANPDRWGLFLRFTGVGLLGVLAYGALFAWAGTWIKRPVLAGLIFVFGWESVIQFMPGVTQKFTLVHWLKSLLPQLGKNTGPLAFQLEPSGTSASVAVLLVLGLAALLAGAFIFRRKEYIISESN
ncbi:MAG: ABC transporter permease subunit [Acidobacteria bacterium]|nr:ABC transporter permease subunit [Acidobacteriota bacterium]